MFISSSVLKRKSRGMAYSKMSAFERQRENKVRKMNPPCENEKENWDRADTDSLERAILEYLLKRYSCTAACFGVEAGLNQDIEPASVQGCSPLFQAWAEYQERRASSPTVPTVALLDVCGVKHVPLGPPPPPLPDIIWVRALSFLRAKDMTNSGFVCRTFRDSSALALEPLDRLDMTETDFYDEPGVFLERVLTRSPNMSRLIISDPRTNPRPQDDYWPRQGSTKWSRRILPLIVEMVPRWRQLQYLDIAGCVVDKDDMFILIGEQCKQLKHLDVRLCPGVDDYCISYVAEACEQLQYLNVRGCSRLDPSPDEEVTDWSISQIGWRCKQLQYLDVSGCDVTDDSISIVGRECKQLQYLNVSQCSGVTDNSIRVIGLECQSLLYLDVHGCKVTDASISIIGRECKQLLYLDVYGCKVTDDSISVVGQECKELQYLNVGGCGILTDASISIVWEQCELLKVLCIKNCKGVTDVSFSSGAAPGGKSLRRALWAPESGVSSAVQLLFADPADGRIDHHHTFAWPTTTFPYPDHQHTCQRGQSTVVGD